MSAIKHFIEEAILKEEIDAFLANELSKTGYAGAEISKTPLGTRVIIHAMKPGLVIGRRGTNIHELARIVEEKFKLSNPQIAVSEIEIPELDARVMASRTVDALQRGVNFRRAGLWTLTQIMKAGALGAEIIIKGKLRTQRHRTEKYRAGYLPRSGNPTMTYTRVDTTHIKLKQGMLGVTVKIVPPDAVLPDFKSPIREAPVVAKPELQEVAPEANSSEEKDDTSREGSE